MRIKFNDFLHVLNATANEMAENVKMLEKTGMSLSYISISKKLKGILYFHQPVFQKSNIGWPQQPPTENVLYDISWFYQIHSKYQIKSEFKNLDDCEVLSSDLPRSWNLSSLIGLYNLHELNDL